MVPRYILYIGLDSPKLNVELPIVWWSFDGFPPWGSCWGCCTPEAGFRINGCVGMLCFANGLFNNCLRSLNSCAWELDSPVNPLWAELRLYSIFHYFMCFSDVTGPNLENKTKNKFLPLTVKICRQGQNLTFRSN